MSDAAEAIGRLASEREDRTDAELLAELRGMRPLPSYVGPGWTEDEPSPWTQAFLLIALSDLAAERRLSDAVPLVLERMCVGDPGELMRGVRHALEGAVADDWALLTRHCMAACSSPHAGARYWAADELGVLREPVAVDALSRLLDDPVDAVAEVAAFALNLTARDHPAVIDRVLAVLRSASDRRPGLQIAGELAEVEQYRKDA